MRDFIFYLIIFVFLTILCGCSKKCMITSEPFGTLSTGEDVTIWHLENASGASMDVTDYGCRIVRICMPDRNGKMDDVVVGYGDLESFEKKRYENIGVEGKSCVVIGRSNIVGKPMAMLLLHANGTVTICHSRTQNLKEVCREADILVASIGKPEFVKGDMVKEGAIVVDVGINRIDGKLCGDVDFENVKEIAGYITPVPGGVGPMTIAMLMHNVVKAAKQQ